MSQVNVQSKAQGLTKSQHEWYYVKKNPIIIIDFSLILALTAIGN